MTEIQKGSRVRVTLEAELVGDYRSSAVTRPDLYVQHGGGTYAIPGVTAVEVIAPPKPAEPTGLGAVVEDADGLRWTRVGATTGCWVADGQGLDGHFYDDIDAVRVLSEGVSA